MSWIQYGNSILGETSGEKSGYSVSISNDGSIVAIGVPYHTSLNRGTVRIYKYNSGTEIWDQLGTDIDGDYNLDTNGWSVSLSSDGTIVAIGAHVNDAGGPSSGHVTIHKYDSGVADNWDKIGTIIGEEGAQSGYSVSLSS